MIKNSEKNSLLDAPPPTLMNRLIFFVLCAGMVLTCLLFGTVHPPTIALFWVSAGIIAVLWAADALFGGALRFSRSWLQIPLIAAILFGLIQIVPFGSTEIAGLSVGRTISFDSYQTLQAVWQFGALLIFFAAALAFVDSPKRLKFLALFITIFGFAFAFYAVIQHLLDPATIYGVWERPLVQPFGSFVNKHNFAAYIEMCAAIPLGLLFSGAVEREKRVLYLVAIALMGIALVLSGSRGGLVALVAELIFLVFVTTKTRTAGGIALKVALVVGLLAAIVGGTILIGGDASALNRFAETANSKDPTSSRLQIWATTWEIIKHNPIAGAGWGAFGTIYTQFDPLNGRERVEQAHNDYLQILADAGIVGAILGASFLFFLFRDGWRRIQSRDIFRRGVAVGALAGCFAILIHSFFDFVLHTTAISLLFLILAALATAGEQVESEDAPPAPKRRKASVTSIDSKRKARTIDDEPATA